MNKHHGHDRASLAELRRSTRGASMVEYIAILGLVVLAAVAAFRAFGSTVDGEMTGASGHVAQLVGQGNCKNGVCTGPNSCFVAGTTVATPEGPRAIEAIRVGDVVLSRDDRTFAWSERRVTETFVTKGAALVDVTLDGGEGTEAIRATPGHPFFTGDRGWVEAQWLVPGELVMNARGSELRVVHVDRLAERATVYNFEVEGTHTYFVGRATAWVHNPTTCPGTFPADYVPVNDTSGTTNCYYCTTAAIAGTTVSTLQQATGVAPINGGAPAPHITQLMQHVGVGDGTSMSATDMPTATQQLIQAAASAPHGKTFGVAYTRPDGTGHMVAGVVVQGKPMFVDFQQHPPLVSDSIQGASQVHVFPTTGNGTAMNNAAFQSAEKYGTKVPHLN